MHEGYLQVPIDSRLLAKFNMINYAKNKNPTSILEAWIRSYIEENKDVLHLYNDEAMEKYEDDQALALKKLRVKFEELLDKNISEAGRLFVLWNKDKEYSTEIFNWLARIHPVEEEIQGLTEAEKWLGTGYGKWETWLTENSNGFPYDNDFRGFAYSIFRNKEEKDSYLEFCRENSQKTDEGDKIFYLPGARDDEQ